jgi:alpha-tubulin suppressor-like RCC1 family protein
MDLLEEGSLSDPLPTPVNGGPYATVSTGYLFGCAVETGGPLVCFGTNEGSQLGVEASTQSESPVIPAPALAFAATGAGRSHACGLTSDGVVYCWGGIGSGSDGTEIVRTPSRVVGCHRRSEIAQNRRGELHTRVSGVRA